MDFDTVLKLRMKFLHSLEVKNEEKSVRGLEKKRDNVECKVNHRRLDVGRKSGKSEAIIFVHFFVSLKAHALSFTWSAGSGGFLE